VTPFLTLYTPTYRRPVQLAACLASVSAQTARADVEHLIIADHVGRGIEGMYAQVPEYTEAVHGHYVHILADDDVLASTTVVEEVREFAKAHHHPALILVTATKAGQDWPAGPPWPPCQGRIDLGCTITRADIWRRYARAGAYGTRYEGDFDFLMALHNGGIVPAICPIRFLYGAVSRGRPEGVLA